MRVGLTPGCNGCLTAMADSNYARDHTEECRKRHEKDAQSRNDAKLARGNHRMTRALVKLSKGVIMSNNTIMGDEQAQVVESSKKRAKIDTSSDIAMLPINPDLIPQNQPGTGNSASVKRRADADKDDMELADDYEIDVRAAENIDKDSSINAFFPKHN